MKLKSFGCSFIFGTDLNDTSQKTIPWTSSCRTWPAHLAHNFGYEYQCLARPGSGNLQIAERVLSHAANDEGSFFVIGWTWIDRFDYTGTVIGNDFLRSRWKNWQTLMPVDSGDLAMTYYKKLHSEFKDKLLSLMNIKLVIDTLKQKEIPFLMTYMDHLLFDQKWNHTPAVIDLQDFIEPYMLTFEGKNFLDWSRDQGFPISESWHPLEEAHKAAAQYFSDQFAGLL